MVDICREMKFSVEKLLGAYASLSNVAQLWRILACTGTFLCILSPVAIPGGNFYGNREGD